MGFDHSLRTLVDSNSIEWCFVGGKGGVGKTTVSCSLAVQMCKNRESVLIVSTDPAHNVSDAFAQKFSSTPTKVKGFDNLYALETDPTQSEFEGINVDGKDSGMMSSLKEMIQSFPGIDEALGFGELMSFVQGLNFSTVIFDTAPTGHTLKLLNFPNLIDEAFSKFSGLSSAFETINKMLDSNISENAGAQLQKMRAATRCVCEIMRDPARTTFVCVCIPEFLSVYETERLIQQTLANGIDTRYIVVNQVIALPSGYERCPPPSSFEATSDDAKNLKAAYEKLYECDEKLYKSVTARRKLQSKYLKQIEELYCSDFHVVCMTQFPEEVRGVDYLNKFGEKLISETVMPIIEGE